MESSKKSVDLFPLRSILLNDDKNKLKSVNLIKDVKTKNQNYWSSKKRFSRNLNNFKDGAAFNSAGREFQS